MPIAVRSPQRRKPDRMIIYLRLFEGDDAVTPRAGAEFIDFDEALKTALEAARGLAALEPCDGADSRWFQVSDVHGNVVGRVDFRDLPSPRAIRLDASGSPTPGRAEASRRIFRTHRPLETGAADDTQGAT